MKILLICLFPLTIVSGEQSPKESPIPPLFENLPQDVSGSNAEIRGVAMSPVVLERSGSSGSLTERFLLLSLPRPAQEQSDVEERLSFLRRRLSVSPCSESSGGVSIASDIDSQSVQYGSPLSPLSAVSVHTSDYFLSSSSSDVGELESETDNHEIGREVGG